MCALEVCPHTPTDPLTCRCAAIPRNNSLHLTSFRAPTFPISKLTTSVFPGFHRTGTLKTHRFSAATPAAHLKRLYRTCSGFHSLSRSATSAGACPDRDLALYGNLKVSVRWIYPSRQGRIYRPKRSGFETAGGARSESALSLNWITSCLPTTRTERSDALRRR